MINYRILILDLEEDSSTEIRNILRNYGYEVIRNLITNDYIKDINEKMPHIILINHSIENKIKTKICKILKNDKNMKEIPIIAISNSLSTFEKEKLISSGVEDYLLYPFNEKEFLLKIKNQTKLVSLQRQLTMTQNALAENLDMIRKQKNELERNLNLAVKIQEALIPKSLGNIPNCSFTWTFQPSGKVGGDIFDVFMLDEDHVGLYMLDVMGHGIASSMLAVTLSETLILDIERGSPLKRKIDYPPYYEIVSPVEVIEYLNKRFPFAKYNHYFTIFYMVLNVKTGVLKYIRAGHPTPLLVKDTGEVVELDAYGTLVGLELCEEYEEQTVYLDSGDRLIIYTDGLLEIKDQKGNTLEYEGIIDCVKKNTGFVNGNYITEFNKIIRQQTILKDDLSILEMRWVKFV